MILVQGALLLGMAAVYLVQEFRLRRASGGVEGVLNHLRWPIAVVPLVLYIGALMIFSLGRLDGLGLTAALTCALLPLALGAVSASIRPDLPVGVHAAVAGACSVLGLVVLALQP